MSPVALCFGNARLLVSQHATGYAPLPGYDRPVGLTEEMAMGRFDLMQPFAEKSDTKDLIYPRVDKTSRGLV